MLIVNAPNTSKERKQFLGYEWSGAKGREGIKYIGGETVNDIITPLLDPHDLNNDTKINIAIKSNFNGAATTPLPNHCHYSQLTDMLDFSRIDFDKAISLSRQQTTDIETRWKQETIDNLLIKIDGNTTRIKEDEILETGTTAVVTQEQGSLIAGYTEQPEIITDLPCIVFGDHSCTFKFIDFPFVRGADGTQLLKVDEDRLIAKCFFYLVQLVDIPNSDEYERHFKYLRNSRLPVPPLDVQQKIIAQCEAVDHQVDQAHQTIATARQEIKQELQTVARSGYEMKSIAAVLTLEYGISLPQKKRRGGAFPVYGSNGVVGSHNQFLVSAPCIIVGRKGSAGEINWSDKNCTPIDTTFYVKLQDASATDLKFTYHMLRLLNLPSLKAGSGPGGINRNNVYQLQIPVPPLKIQQQLVAKLDELELEITQAQAVIEAATERKTAILKNYL